MRKTSCVICIFLFYSIFLFAEKVRLVDFSTYTVKTFSCEGLNFCVDSVYFSGDTLKVALMTHINTNTKPRPRESISFSQDTLYLNYEFIIPQPDTIIRYNPYFNTNDTIFDYSNVNIKLPTPYFTRFTYSMVGLEKVPANILFQGKEINSCKSCNINQ